VSAPPTAGAAQTPAAIPAETAYIAAVQTILDYYTAIDEQRYPAAYALWGDDGAASQQSLASFQQGFARTVRVSVQIGDRSQASIAPDSASVQVPVSLLAVVNAASAQSVQHYRGSYTLAPQSADGDWRIVSATLAEAPNPAPSDPGQLLQGYYQSINAGDFGRAYTDWGQNGLASQQSFSQFVQGFATTGQVAIRLGPAQEEGAAGSVFATLPVVIVETQNSQPVRTFCGTYTLRRSNLPPFDQLGWRIERASIAAAAPVAIDSDAAQQLLDSGCQ
jgi:hypothetical protein